MHGYGGMGLGMAWYWILGVLIVVSAVWLIARSVNQNSSANTTRSALDILKERYAKGEIDNKEFEEKKSHLIS